jgi:hypothetical protein
MALMAGQVKEMKDGFLRRVGAGSRERSSKKRR